MAQELDDSDLQSLGIRGHDLILWLILVLSRSAGGRLEKGKIERSRAHSNVDAELVLVLYTR